jgi:hypothetical protein
MYCGENKKNIKNKSLVRRTLERSKTITTTRTTSSWMSTTLSSLSQTLVLLLLNLFVVILFGNHLAKGQLAWSPISVDSESEYIFFSFH